MIARPHPVVTQDVGEAVGPGVEIAIRQPPLAVDDGRPGGDAVGHRLEQVGEVERHSPTGVPMTWASRNRAMSASTPSFGGEDLFSVLTEEGRQAPTTTRAGCRSRLLRRRLAGRPGAGTARRRGGADDGVRDLLPEPPGHHLRVPVDLVSRDHGLGRHPRLDDECPGTSFAYERRTRPPARRRRRRGAGGGPASVASLGTARQTVRPRAAARTPTASSATASATHCSSSAQV